MQRGRAGRGVAVAALLLAAAWAGAAEPDRRPYFVGEVVVKAKAGGEPAAAPGAVDVLTAEEIRQLGATTVAEAVAHLPGVFASTGGRNEQRVWMRGYGPSDVLVLLDGIPIADPYSGEVDLGQIPLGDVARIVVARGGASTAYGAGALGGVINIVTVEGGEETSGEADIRATGERTVLAHASAGGRSGALDWVVGVGRERSDGWPLSDDFEPTEWQGTGRRVNSGFARWSVLGRAGVTLEAGSRLSATLRLLDAEKGIPFHTHRPQGFVRFARFPEWRQATAAVGFESAADAAVGVRAQVFAHRYDNTLDIFDGPELEELSLRSTFADRVLGGYVVADRSRGRHGLRGALHLRRDRHERLEAAAGEGEVPTERFTSWVGSLSGEDRVVLSRRLSLLLAAAVEHRAVTESWRAAGGEGATSSGTRVSPRLELEAALGEGVRGRWSVYRTVSFPTLRQLFIPDAPNPGLEPQRATGTTVGVEWRPSPSATLTASAYHDRVDDLITRQGRGFPYLNQDRAEMTGLEVSASGRRGRLEGRLAAVLQRADFASSVEGYDEVPYVPDSTLEAGVGVRLGADGFVRLDWSRVGERVWYDRSSREVLDAYHLIRLAGGVTWRDLELRLDIANAADADVEQEWGYPLPGRRAWVTLRAEF